jgi:hypothetical protein
MPEEVWVDPPPNAGDLCQRANHLGDARSAKRFNTASATSSGCQKTTWPILNNWAALRRRTVRVARAGWPREEQVDRADPYR